MVKELLLTLMLLLPLSATADPFTLAGGESKFSLAAGPDVHQDQGKIYGEFRYRETLHTFRGDFWDEFGFSLYTGSMITIGGDLYITHGSWMYGLGIEGAKKDTEVVDSTGGYELLIEYGFNAQWALSFKHRSNCRTFCRHLSFMPKGDKDKKNGGFNFIMLRYSF